jgi:hypothetical protein
MVTYCNKYCACNDKLPTISAAAILTKELEKGIELKSGNLKFEKERALIWH